MTESADLAEPELSREFFRLLGGNMAAQVVYVAARLRLADHIAAGTETSAELAGATGTHEPSLRRLLRAMACLGLLTETEPGRFELASLGTPLRSGVPQSVVATALLNLREEGWRAWGELLHSVRTGEPAFEHLYGMGVFDYTLHNPEVAHVFNDAMQEHTRNAAEAIARGYDFSPFATIIDVGGNNGALLTAILAANPSTRGVVFDTPTGVDGATEALQAAGLADRCEVTGGDFFAEVPAGGDAYVLKAVIHDWDDEHSRKILGSCRASIPDGGTLLLIEQVMPDRVDSTATMSMAASDLNMLVYTGGRERTEGEFRALLAEAGFVLTSVSPLMEPTDYRVLAARPA